MLEAMKKQGKVVKAYCLGERGSVVEKLIQEKKLVDLGDGKFEVMSQEAVKGGSGHGQLAKAGDYIKVDNAGFPYPNDAEYFKKHHKHLNGDEYEQIPAPLAAWTVDEPMCKEVEFLIKEKGLVLNEQNADKYFNAVLWGTQESAAKNSVLIFYSISYDEQQNVTDAEFNFVVRDEFEKTYDFI